jgi:hypothetical protein
MSDPYPLPSYAAHIWARGQELVLQFPPLAQGEQSSTITFPMTERGISCLLRIMQERGRVEDLRLGFKGTPCKRTIEDAIHSQDKYKAWIVALSSATALSSAEKAAAMADLEALGL